MSVSNDLNLSQKQLMRRFSIPDGPDKSHCIRSVSLMLDEDNKAIQVKSRNGSTSSIPYSHVPAFRELIKQGFVMDEYLTAKRNTVGVVLLRKKDSDPRRAEFGLVGLELERGDFACCSRVVSNHCSERLFHVEVLSMAANSDRSILGLSLGMLMDCVPMQESYENCVIFYRTKDFQEIRRYQSSSGNVVSDISFHPTKGRQQYAITALGSYGTPYVSEYDLYTGQCLSHKTIHEMSDYDADNTFCINYNSDGKNLILQTIEAAGYSSDVLYTTLILEAGTLKTLRRCKPAMAKGCHQDCAPDIAPFFSPSGKYMVLANHVGKKKPREFDFYRLPQRMNLKELAKSAILENISSMVAVNKLPVPPEMREYIKPMLVVI